MARQVRAGAKGRQGGRDRARQLDLSATRRRPGIQVIARAAEILRIVHAASNGLKPAQVAEQVNLPRSTVYRILDALREEGFVTDGEEGVLHVGPEVGRLGTTSRSTRLRLARPLLERLAVAVNETVDLAVLEGDQVRFIDQAAAGQRLRAASVVGERFPAYCTANGKALLAELPVAVVNGLLAGPLPVRTRTTITSHAKLLEEFEQVRETRIAFDREEHTERICAVGTVVRDAVGVVAAVTVAAPAERFYGREEFLAAALLKTAGQVTEALGPPGE